MYVDNSVMFTFINNKINLRTDKDNIQIYCFNVILIVFKNKICSNDQPVEYDRI